MKLLKDLRTQHSFDLGIVDQLDKEFGGFAEADIPYHFDKDSGDFTYKYCASGGSNATDSPTGTEYCQQHCESLPEVHRGDCVDHCVGHFASNEKKKRWEY